MIRRGARVTVFDRWPETRGRTFTVESARDGIIYAREDQEPHRLRAFPRDCVDEEEPDGRAGGPEEEPEG